MKDEIQRIIKLVQEGKLSAEDAAELIDAFAASDTQEPSQESAETPPPPPGSPKDPFKAFVESMERLGKEASSSVNWQDVAKQVREGAKKGVEALRSSIGEISKGGMPWFGAQDTREVTLPITVPAGKTLRIENPCGDVRVSGGFDRGTVSAKAHFRAASLEEARSKAEAYTLVVEESDHIVLLRQPDVTGLAVDLDLQLVDAGMVEVKCDSGDIELLDTKGGCRVRGRSGDVKLRGLNGPIEVVSDNGDLSVEDCATPGLSVENKSGNILLREVRGNLSARTASGDVRVRECSAKVVSVESVSGDVSVDLTEPVTGSVNVRTVNGGAEVGVMDGSDCRVSLSTIRGTVVCDLPLQDEARVEQHLTGRLGAGTGTLDVSAVNGSISLRLRDQVAAG